jgi:hypothetical protein
MKAILSEEHIASILMVRGRNCRETGCKQGLFLDHDDGNIFS